MLGIDIYQRYNAVSNWHAVYDSGVRHVYVKLTDGGGRAMVAGDAYVAGARAAGCEIGGYHYMQASPSPEAQAAVFATELARLRALDDVPALDLEEPTIPVAVRADYGRRFLVRLQSILDIPRVALYASASWMASLRPDTWNVPGLIPWAAQYGPNDGAQHSITAYGGHVDIHQYTSAGRVPGISSGVDMNDIRTDISLKGLPDMDWNTQVIDPGTGQLAKDINGNPYSFGAALFYTNQQIWVLGAQLTALQAAMAALVANTSITTDELTTIVDTAVASHLQITGTVSISGGPVA